MFQIEHNILTIQIKNKKRAQETIRHATQKNLVIYLMLLVTKGIKVKNIQIIHSKLYFFHVSVKENVLKDCFFSHLQ